jgi:cytochrome c556
MLGVIMAQIKCAIAILMLSAAAAAQTARSAQPDAIVDTPEFMTLLLKPAYVDVQRAVDKPPADRAEWAATYQKAVRLAETANLLFIRRHAGADTPEWAQRSAAARDAGAAVVDAVLVGLRNARPQDFEQVTAAFAQVSVACNACHRRFGGTNAPTIRD